MDYTAPIKDAIRGAFKTFDAIAGQSKQTFEQYIQPLAPIDNDQFADLNEYISTIRDMAEELAMHPVSMLSSEKKLLKGHADLLAHSLKKALGKTADEVIAPERGDHRFQDSAWKDSVVFNYLMQAYLLNARAITEVVDNLEDNGSHTHDQFVFYTRQLVNAFSPTNFIVTNPEVLRKVAQTGGANLIDGVRQFWQDYKRSPKLLNVAMTDFSVFEVGKNVASTPGSVVFENDMMQLLQYSPSTAEVYKTPVLIVPPWINKFYILDLKASNSYIKWLVDQGHTVFVISWVNPGPNLRDKTFENYLLEGTVAAMEAIEKATGEPQVNAVGYCIGGTLLGATLAWLKAKKMNRVKSATYLTTLLDFSDPGEIGIFINERSIANIEKKMNKAGYFDGRAMAFSFNLLRENDLFWAFFVNNYLKGEKPVAFDLLYWNSDGTNLPAAMHSYYLRNMYLYNRLVQPGALELAGEKIDLGNIDIPVFFLSTIQDHIAKWKTTYKGALAHNTDVQFVLSGSGHIAGVVNPPSKVKYGYWTNSELPESSDEWLDGAEEHEGSWWPHWQAWLAENSGEMVAARIPGDGELEVIEAAPGRYVKRRIIDVI